LPRQALLDGDFLVQDRFQPPGDQFGPLDLEPFGELVGSVDSSMTSWRSNLAVALANSLAVISE
jgi:hypothetical protein